MKYFLNNISQTADIFAIPFFLLLTIYFYNKKNKNTVEKLLLLFGISGLIADLLFTIHFLSNVEM